MELLFIRHAQGEHNLAVPDRLNIEHPHLTEQGRRQAEALKSRLVWSSADLLLVSPTVRAIETANIIWGNSVFPHKYISPLAGPRMFPLRPKRDAVKCDIPLPYERVIREYPDYIPLNAGNRSLWSNGINAMSEAAFRRWGRRLLDWAEQQAGNRLVMVSHDGTITSYRQLLGERGLTRDDFLGEAGTYVYKEK